MNRTKYLKIILLMLLTVFLLSGCVSLQDLREYHAFYTDSTKKTIVWKDKEYHYLTEAYESNFGPEFLYWETLYVTDEEVPVLMAFMEGDEAYFSKDEEFLEVYGEIYCIDNKLDEMKERLKSDEKMDCYAYSYYVDMDLMGGIEGYCKLSDDEKKIFQEIEANCTETKSNHIFEDSYGVTDIYLCSEDVLFKEYHVSLRATDEREYFLAVSEDGNYENNENNKVYMIPQKYYESIEDIFGDVIEVFLEVS